LQCHSISNPLIWPWKIVKILPALNYVVLDWTDDVFAPQFFTFSPLFFTFSPHSPLFSPLILFSMRILYSEATQPIRQHQSCVVLLQSRDWHRGKTNGEKRGGCGEKVKNSGQKVKKRWQIKINSCWTNKHQLTIKGNTGITGEAIV
jgi:hypothetical protein